MSEVKVFNPARLSITLNGIPVEGYAAGTFIEIEPLADASSSVSGANGEVVRVIGTDARHEIRLTLMQTSSGNTLLNTLSRLDKVSCGGAPILFAMTDLCGLDVFIAKSWIAKKPTRSYGVEVTDRVWTLHTGEPDVDVM